jgi:dTMP kinase
MLNRIATREIKPDLTILLDMEVEKGLSRKRTKNEDRFEGEELAFHKRVRSGYLQLALDEPQRWLVIDATLPRDSISNIIWNKVSQLLPSK